MAGKKDFSKVIPEYKYGNSRIDFYMEKQKENGETEHIIMEVKGCTLEINGIGYFPDAPTERGVKHIYELIKAKEAGYRSILCFVIQMDGVKEVRPNIQMHLEFGKAMADARQAGVEIVYMLSHVEPDELNIIEERREDEE